MSHLAADRTPNRLVNSTSPYLLQHAYNPVDWREWSAEALSEAKSSDKPILVSIGYSACHWCHVMERESFEDPDLAALMNEHFICIKVDREERPDVDQVYMEAVQAMGVGGGWPLNVFLTPDQVPFYGGTYFQPRRWAQVLIELSKAFKERRAEVESGASALRDYLQEPVTPEAGEALPEAELPLRMALGIGSRFDKVYGGTAKAPKFIMPSIWLFILRTSWCTGNQGLADMVEKTLTAAACGGIYDQVGGGFARYSVDERWFAPHFEKMLYDNAQLLSLYSEAFLLTGKPLYRSVVEETVEWLSREMTHPGGGFYSALDADSEGVEGKFYCWTDEELRAVLGADYVLAMEYFGCSETGNWEHGMNILTGREPHERPAALAEIKEKLMKARDLRIRPSLDDKVITAWNAMAIKGLVDASLGFGRPEWLGMAVKAWEFSMRYLHHNGRLLRSFRIKPSSTGGFLDDYVFQIQAGLSLYEATLERRYLDVAEQLLHYVNESFSDGNRLYWYTSVDTHELVVRKKETYDNVISSSNAVLASILHRMGILFNRKEWIARSRSMISVMQEPMERNPAYASAWGMAMMEQVHGLDEVVIAGSQTSMIRTAMGRRFFPLSVYCGTEGTPVLPPAEGKTATGGRDTIYICRRYACQAPAFNADEAMGQLERRRGRLGNGR